MTEPKKAIARLSVKDLIDAIEKAPELWPRAKAAILALIDVWIEAAPDALKPALQAIRDQIDAAATWPADLVDQLWTALKDAVLSADWGPATGDDSDLA